jgi:tetratricopeptide (TPR) repeat protein
MGLSDLALYEGRLVDAESILTPALARDEERNDRFAAANKLTTLALVHAERGRLDAAVDAAERSLTRSDAVGVLVRAASVFLAVKPERALEIAAALESRDDADAQSYGILLRGEAALAKGETAQAIDLLRAASERADTWLSRMALGRAFLQAGAFVEASSELDACFRRRGEATALFLDDVPSYHVAPQLHYFLALSQEGLKSAGAADSYRVFLRIKGKGEKTGLVAEAERRLSALE